MGRRSSASTRIRSVVSRTSSTIAAVCSGISVNAPSIDAQNSIPATSPRIVAEAETELELVPRFGVAPRRELVAPPAVVLRSSKTIGPIGGIGCGDGARRPREPPLARLVDGTIRGRRDRKDAALPLDDDVARFAAEARVPPVFLEADRGIIYDRHGAALVANSPVWNLVVTPAALPADAKARTTELSDIARITGVPQEKIPAVLATSDPYADVRVGDRKPAQELALMYHMADAVEDLCDVVKTDAAQEGIRAFLETRAPKW